jgi:hypothetical protein
MGHSPGSLGSLVCIADQMRVEMPTSCRERLNSWAILAFRDTIVDFFGTVLDDYPEVGFTWKGLGVEYYYKVHQRFPKATKTKHSSENYNSRISCQDISMVATTYPLIPTRVVH